MIAFNIQMSKIKFWNDWILKMKIFCEQNTSKLESWGIYLKVLRLQKDESVQMFWYSKKSKLLNVGIFKNKIRAFRI